MASDHGESVAAAALPVLARSIANHTPVASLRTRDGVSVRTSTGEHIESHAVAMQAASP
jgi:hypothetical protein